MFEYGDKDEYVSEQASKLKGKSVQEARGMDSVSFFSFICLLTIATNRAIVP